MSELDNIRHDIEEHIKVQIAEKIKELFRNSDAFVGAFTKAKKEKEEREKE